MRNKLNTRGSVILFCLCASLLITVGTTIAYYLVMGNSITNTFTPAHVACEVVWDEAADAEATVTNTGDTTAYIRVKLVVTWKDANGVVHAQAPVQGRDYVLTQSAGNGWLLGSDGFLYFRDPVSPDASTLPVFEGYTTEDSEKPSGYELSIELVASAIQATTTAVNVWSNGVATAATDGAQLTVN